MQHGVLRNHAPDAAVVCRHTQQGLRSHGSACNIPLQHAPAPTWNTVQKQISQGHDSVEPMLLQEADPAQRHHNIWQQQWGQALGRGHWSQAGAAVRRTL